jgi:hypothetical protein
MYRDATETGGVGFSAGAVEYGWCPSPSPLPPSSPALRERKGGLPPALPAPRPLPPGVRKGELASGTTPWPPVRCHQGRGRGSLSPALPPGPPVRSYQGRGRGSLPPAHPLAPRPLLPGARKGELASGTPPGPPVRCHQGRGRGSLPPALPPGPPSAATRGEEGGACLRHYPLAPRPLLPGARKGGTARKYVGTPSRNDCAGTVCSQ